MLYQISVFINFVFLIASVWLGIYVVTRNPRSAIAWLTGLTLWSVSGLFLNVLLALTPPPLPENVPIWVQWILPFWPIETLESGWSGWLKGWLVIPSIVSWHHVTMLMRPGGMNLWRWVRVAFGYITAAAAIVLLIKTSLVFSSVSGDPLLLNTLKPGPLFTTLIAFLLLFTVLSLVNLLRSAKDAPATMPRKQLMILATATLIAGLTGPTGLMAILLPLSIPRVLLSILLGITVMLIGYGVAQYSALMEGRTIQKDFTYHAVAILIITLLYLLVTWISVQLFNVPAAAYIFMVLLAVITHSMIEVARRTLDSFFYHKDTFALRANLRKLSSLVSEHDLEESLSSTLVSLCDAVHATYGLILIFEQGKIKLAAAYHWQGDISSLNRENVSSDDVRHLELNHLPAPFHEVSLLIPFYSGTEQAGAVLFGRPFNGVRYSDTDVETLLYPVDLLAEGLQNLQRQSELTVKLSQLAASYHEDRKVQVRKIPVKVIEDALRNIFDYAELGDNPLVKIRLISTRLPSGTITHVERGKAVHQLLVEMLEKLRPDGELSGRSIPRQWHPYLILHDAYFEQKMNREIMSRLYISEGTFNRTRRAAIRSVARMLEEMEAALN